MLVTVLTIKFGDYNAEVEVLDDFIAKLEKVRAETPETVRHTLVVNAESEHESSVVELEIQREETTLERINREARWAANAANRKLEAELRERAAYEKLKAKYGAR